MNEEKEHSQYRYLLRRMLYPMAIFAVLIGLAITFRNISKPSDKPPPQNTPTVSLVDFSEVISDSVAYELTPTTEGSSSSLHPLPQAQTGDSMASYPPPPTSPPSYPGPGQGMVYPTATPTPIPVPSCKFDGIVPPVPKELPSLDDFYFGEPKIVPLEIKDNNLRIATWLPDDKRLLISRYDPEMKKEFVETVNVETGKLVKYGERPAGVGVSPAYDMVWLEKEQAVAFLTSAGNNRKYLNISYADERGIKRVVGNVMGTGLTALPNGEQLVFFDATTPHLPYQLNEKKIQGKSVKLKNAPYLKISVEKSSSFDRFQPALQPQGRYLAYYNNQHFYLADLEAHHVCEIGLKRNQWSLGAYWSPNGRYLATLNTIGELPVPYINVTVIDTMTGQHIPIKIEKQANSYLLAWHPNSYHIAVIANVFKKYNELYLVDMYTQESKQLSDNYVVSDWGGLTWTLTGERLALACVSRQEAMQRKTHIQLCIIPVEVK